MEEKLKKLEAELKAIGINSVDDLNEAIKKACKTMQKKYGVEFVFCHNRDQGHMVLELLQREVE